MRCKALHPSRGAAVTVGLALVALASGCDPVEPSPAGIFAPVQVQASVADVTAPEPAADIGADGFDFEAEDRKDEPAEPSDVDDLYGAFGIDAPEDPDGADSSDPPDAPEPVDAAPPEPEVPVAEPAPPTPSAPAAAAATGSWGVRLVSTVRDAQPPRAILGLPDGSERVVTPGALLPDAGLVVLAVGRDAVQIAEISPQGDHATIRTETLQALYPSSAPAPR